MVDKRRNVTISRVKDGGAINPNFEVVITNPRISNASKTAMKINRSNLT